MESSHHHCQVYKNSKLYSYLTLLINLTDIHSGSWEILHLLRNPNFLISSQIFAIRNYTDTVNVVLQITMFHNMHSNIITSTTFSNSQMGTCKYSAFGKSLCT
jgi:hypothetical protein